MYPDKLFKDFNISFAVMKDPKPTKVIYNDPYTTVLFADGSHVVVKAKEEFDEYTGFCVAMTKKQMKSNTQIKKFIGQNKTYIKKKKSTSFIERFKTEPIAINTETQEEYDEFIKYLGKHIDVSKEEYIWHLHKSTTCVDYNLSKSFGYCHDDFYKEAGFEIVKYKDIKGELK